MWVLSILDMMTDEEIFEQQKRLINLQSTLVVKVVTKIGEHAWEVSCEFTVSDLVDLVFIATNEKGKIFCNGSQLDPRLMLGFVRLYIWRKIDLLTLELG